MATTHFHMMAKPTSSRCNLKCEYCFYLEKENSLEQTSLKSASDTMPYSILKRYIKDYIASHDGELVDFSWQGGEPTLAGLAFYEKVVQLQCQYSNGKTITNSFQTNAVAINKQWASFFAKHRFLLGISVDGTPDVHDKYRISVNGRPTFERVKKAIDLLIEQAVEFNILTVINDQNWQRGKETYQFLKSFGAKHLQFIPIVEVTHSSEHSSYAYSPCPNQSMTSFSVPPYGYGKFMTDVFNEWIKKDVGHIFVRMFDSILGTWLGYPSSVCVQAKTCGQSMVIEANGDIYSCDHFVYPANKLGNIENTSLKKLVNSKKQHQFGQNKERQLTNKCHACDLHQLCFGGCPKHRIKAINGEKYKQNYLCESYQQIFTHTAPAMHMMSQAISQGRTAMDAVPHILHAMN